MTVNENASKPHERLMFNLAVVHFLLPALLFNTEIIWLIVGVPMLVSALIIASIYRQSVQPVNKSALVRAHWQLAWKRSRYLLLAYIVSLIIFAVAAALLLLQSDPQMRQILWSIAGWFSLLPISIVIGLLLIIEGSALVQARNGVMPDAMKL